MDSSTFRPLSTAVVQRRFRDSLCQESVVVKTENDTKAYVFLRDFKANVLDLLRPLIRMLVTFCAIVGHKRNQDLQTYCQAYL